MRKILLENVHGYSSHQLVYGCNPNLPTTLNDGLPALEGTSTSEYVTRHLTALHAARKGFIAAESSERIRRALRKQVRTLDNFVTGDKVYYKRLESNEWKGPGVVIGQDGVVVFVRHGGTYVRVHRCRLTKFKDSTNVSAEGITKKIVDSTTDNFIASKVREDDNSPQVNVEADDDSDEEIIPQRENAHPQSHSLRSNMSQVTPQIGQFMKFSSGDGERKVVKILSRAGKASGKHNNWYNVEYFEPHSAAGLKQSIDMGRVSNLEIANAPDNPENILIVESSFDKAKQEELQKWKEFAVYKEVKDVGQRCISTRWICTIKESPEGNVQKARLVARCFEDLERSGIKTDSPTCDKESLRVIFSIVAQKAWKLKSMDIKTAFLQGTQFSRNIFVRPPKEAKVEHSVWHLQKCVYGLSDASLCWYNKVKEVMLDCGAAVSSVDPAVFYWFTEELRGILASHVDDFIWAGDDKFERDVIDKIKARLCVGQEEAESFQYIGLHLQSESCYVTLDQHKYAQSLQPVPIRKERAREKELPLTSEETDKLRSKVGQLLWIANQTRPDVLFDVSSLCSTLKNAKVLDLLETNKVIRKIHSENVRLSYHGKKRFFETSCFQ
ncbi:uncharacterized protein [Apostichopus japonicus]|uniref:uncharacterized protein n=1 Tax=Stichopus japonicus TaxID=307972 RepID=UPI003AB4DE5A